jgi:hypothetical protein
VKNIDIFRISCYIFHIDRTEATFATQPGETKEGRMDLGRSAQSLGEAAWRERKESAA